MASDVQSSIVRLMQRLEAGDGPAAAELFEQYFRRLVGLARKRLDERLKAKLDADDVVQSVLASFFAGCEAGRFRDRISNRDDLWSLLATITARKCIHKHHDYHTAKRDVSREQRLADGSAAAEGEVSIPIADPTQEEATVLVETIEEAMAHLADPRLRNVFQLWLHGSSVAETAEQMTCSEATVLRKRKEIRSRLGKLGIEGA